MGTAPHGTKFVEKAEYLQEPITQTMLGKQTNLNIDPAVSKAINI